MVVQNRLTGLRHAPDIAVGHGPVHLLQERGADAVREFEAEIAGVAGVQLQHRGSGGLHPQGFFIQRPPNVRVDVGQPVRSCNHGIPSLYPVGEVEVIIT